MASHEDEETQLRAAALRNAQSILSARRRVEEELRRDSDWLRITLSSIGDAVISTDDEARVTFMNGVAESLTGWLAADARGRPLPEVFHIVHEKTRELAENPAMRALLEGVVVGLSNHTLLIAKDGSERPIDDSAAPIRSSDGVIIGCVLVFRDVSERHRVEQALRASEAFSRSVLESSPDCVHVLDSAGCVVNMNANAARQMGLVDSSAFRGRPWTDCWPKTAGDSVLAAVEAARATGQGRFECSFLAAGKVRWWDVVIAPVLEEDGKISRFVSVSRDVSDHVEAESALGRIAAIVESSDDAIISKQLDGTITSWNASAERMFGYKAEEVIGKHISIIVPSERRAEEDGVLARLRRGEKIDHFETVRRAKDGRRLNISLTVSPVRDSSGRIIGASKVARDITERKQAEAEREALLASERRARAEAERAGRLKEEFLATLSHELRTPLNAILGWIQILRKKPPTKETMDQGLSVIDRNAKMQAQLIADLLDMSRIISGKMRMDVHQVELPLVIEAALESVRPAADAKGVTIESVLGAPLDPVYGDASRLQQVIWNLVSNAVKFTPRGGRVQVTLTRADSHVEIAVSDTGKGIDPAFLPHVFERFRQGDSSAAREHGGLGLGLAIVKQLVELHGGSVRAESSGEGRGSVFIIQLPVSAVPIPAVSQEMQLQGAGSVLPPHDPPDLRGVRVLVVDDEPDARDLVRRMLQECEAEVVVAGSAAEGIAAVERAMPHVILSDIGMPERDGYEFMKAIRRSGVRTPAAALTAFARLEDRMRALTAGYQTHIAKPVDPFELLAAVAALAHKSGASERDVAP